MSDVNQDLFINPGVDLTLNGPDLATVINLPLEQLRRRWQSQHGNYILTRWKANGFGRTAIEEMVGKFHGHTDLRGIPLSGENLQGVNLSNIDFFGSDLSGATFDRVDLSSSWLSRCNLRRTTFNWSKLDGVLLDDVDFDHKTSFLGTDLRAINFTLAALVQENAVREQRIQHLKRHNLIFAGFLMVTCDYGRSFTRFLLCCLVIVVLFGLAFHFIPNALNANTLSQSLFFSFLTFIKASAKDTSVASELGRTLFMFEASVGYVMLGVMVSIIVRKILG